MGSHHAPRPPMWRRVLSPQSSSGRWAIGLAAAYVLNLIYMIYAIYASTRIPFIHHTIGVCYIWAVSLCGWAAAIVGLIAVISRDEHTGVVWLAIMVGLLSIVTPFLFFYNALITI